MSEPTDLAQKVTELETKVKQLQIATLVMLNLIFVVYLLAR
ncbi:MAG: hypothetical protein WBV23_03795 [Desulfobaccales bacterium]